MKLVASIERAIADGSYGTLRIANHYRLWSGKNPVKDSSHADAHAIS
ncbi:hypothetical protein [Olsenella sp. An270]|nr:hypothetical protein [Olsenella sp. An270]